MPHYEVDVTSGDGDGETLRFTLIDLDKRRNWYNMKRLSQIDAVVYLIDLTTYQKVREAGHSSPHPRPPPPGAAATPVQQSPQNPDAGCQSHTSLVP